MSSEDIVKSIYLYFNCKKHSTAPVWWKNRLIMCNSKIYGCQHRTMIDILFVLLYLPVFKPHDLN